MDAATSTSMPPAVATQTSKAVLAERFKTKVCHNYLMHGECPYQHRCMFAHGDHEMRTKEMNLRDGLTTEDAIKAFRRRDRPATVMIAPQHSSLAPQHYHAPSHHYAAGFTRQQAQQHYHQQQAAAQFRHDPYAMTAEMQRYYGIDPYYYGSHHHAPAYAPQPDYWSTASLCTCAHCHMPVVANATPEAPVELQHECVPSPVAQESTDVTPTKPVKEDPIFAAFSASPTVCTVEAP